VKRKRLIAVYDSGIGGLSIIPLLQQNYSDCDILYYADTKYFPYGEKSADQLAQIAQETLAFLKSYPIDLLIIACHTASIHFLSLLQDQFPFAVIGVSQSIREEKELLSNYNRVGLIGTKATIESGYYQTLLHQQCPKLTVVSSACPHLVVIAEEQLYEEKYIQIMNFTWQQLKTKEIQGLIFACTHFSFLMKYAKAFYGEELPIFSHEGYVMRQVKHYLGESSSDFLGTIEIVATKENTAFKQKVESLLQGIFV